MRVVEPNPRVNARKQRVESIQKESNSLQAHEDIKGEYLLAGQHPGRKEFKELWVEVFRHAQEWARLSCDSRIIKIKR